MKKRNHKKYIALLLASLMTINSGITAFAQNYTASSGFQSESKTSGSVIITKDGVIINGVYYTKGEFTNLLNQAIEISGSNNDIQPRMAIAAGVYFIPGIGEIAIAATGAIVVAGVTIAVGSWLYNTITDWLNDSDARKIAKIKGKIPARVRDDNGDVDLGKFDQKVNGKGKVAYKEKGGWTIEKDTAGHGDRKWKLKDKKDKRVASLGENGEVLAD
ncbi:hypothetical protein SAMN05443270_0430 [Lacrimispora sphenoides]|jgi:hypothetical protein|uniref:hypothetical protein n=1 Tax=Lacrimispora sphenoides TaxID=29370 RepID=UPI0008B7718C|nr:hypothetical protein [Lacrimispora sphenoides]SET54334.1 hypothetical protein SAMN05443270_0430 [Lacrimispora sphenoides]